MRYEPQANSPYDPACGKPPTEAWLFGLAIQGKPIPQIVRPEQAAQAKLEELERLAEFSPRHADELRAMQAAQARARHERELLEWAAGISSRAEEQLRALEAQEAEERAAWRRAEEYAAIIVE